MVTGTGAPSNGHSTRGVQALTYGSCYVAHAGDFQAYDAAPYSTGVNARSLAGSFLSFGVHGSSLALAPHNFGVFGFAGDQSYSVALPPAKRTGVGGIAQSADQPTVCYGVYGRADGPDDPGGTLGHSKWAGYFPGNTYVANLVGPSDAQLKQNIEDLPGDSAKAKLQQLFPKTFDFNQDQFGFMHLPSEHQYGLIAQEVASVLPELVTTVHQPAMWDTSGAVVSPAIDFKAMNYQGLIPILIAGFQSQQQQLDQQQTTIAQLQAQIDQCCAAQNPGMAPGSNSGMKSAPAKENVQEQRLVIQPNPFTDHTTLGYFVPQAGKVSLQVSTSEGKPLGTLREEQAEPGSYTYEWNTSKLATGTYFCTFMLDGAVVVKRVVKVAR